MAGAELGNRDAGRRGRWNVSVYHIFPGASDHLLRRMFAVLTGVRRVCQKYNETFPEAKFRIYPEVIRIVMI